jgi:N-acetylmuramoyl-L-alanine amidase
MMRGDDVGELQVRLGSLGFDPGRVDGYFGESTRLALIEFQENLALPADGICGPSTVDELKRLFGRSNEHIHGVREREYLRNHTRSSAELSVIVCAAEELASIAELFSLRLRQSGIPSHSLHDGDQSTLATVANSLHGDICIYLDFSTSGAQLAYYSGFSYTSPGGEQVAKFLARSYSALLPTPLTLKGMTLPILRETKMLTVAVQLSPASVWVNRAPELADLTVQSLLEFSTDSEL